VKSNWEVKVRRKVRQGGKSLTGKEKSDWELKSNWEVKVRGKVRQGGKSLEGKVRLRG
jgi:hypothetical protein